MVVADGLEVADGIVMAYNNTMEHTATVTICKKNPNESESGVSRQSNI